MHKPLNILLTVAALSITGCASVDTVDTAPKSRASILLDASGMKGRIIDQTVQDPSFWDTKSGATAEAISAGLSAPSVGLSGGAMLGLGLLAASTKPDPDLSRSSIFFWAPRVKGEKEGAVRVAYMNKYLEVSKEVLDEMGITYGKVLNGSGKYGYRFGQIVVTEQCAHDDHCAMMLDLNRLHKDKMQRVSKQDGHYWYAKPSNTNLPSSIRPTKADRYKGVNELEFVRRISERMPYDFYAFYLPGDLWIDESSKNEAPLMIENGKIEYFITPKTASN
jgi:hypothetical protein